MSEDQKTVVEDGVKVIVGGEVFVARHGDTIGRAGTVAPEFFSQVPTVSREHVFIKKNSGRWYISVPEWVVNSTQLDGVEVKRNTDLLIAGKHVLKMSSDCQVTLEV